MNSGTSHMTFPSRPTSPLAVITLLFFATASADVNVPAYPPQRDGISPAVATLNVNVDMLSHGATIYQDNCNNCHGDRGVGGGELWAQLSAKPKDLTAPALMNYFSDMELATIIQYGGFEMPAHPHIRGDDLIALVAFVRSLSHADLREIELHSLSQKSWVIRW